MKAAILASGRGSNAEAIFKQIRDGNLKGVEISCLISDIREAPALGIAEEFGVCPIWISPMRKGARMTQQSTNIYIDFLRSQNVELVILAGFMRILPPEFISAFPRRIINLHPSLLPLYKGKDAIKQAFDDGAKHCGCSVHFVSNELDGGEIIRQKTVVAPHGCTLETLETAVHEAEHQLLPSVIADIASGKIKLG